VAEELLFTWINRLRIPVAY